MPEMTMLYAQERPLPPLDLYQIQQTPTGQPPEVDILPTLLSQQQHTHPQEMTIIPGRSYLRLPQKPTAHVMLKVMQ